MSEEQAGKRKQDTKGGIGFRYAFRGAGHLFRTQRNARIHLLIAIIVILSGWWLGLSTAEWVLVTLCIGLVIAAEMFNTAIEYLTDLVSPGFNEQAGIVKDIAAGAVLVSAIAAAIAGLLIFGPKILEITGTWFGSR